MRINWDNDTFCLGITKIDDQHKQLVALINALDERKASADKEFVEKILNTLVHYTRVHFSAEEKIMLKIRYPGYDAHVRQHHNFIAAVNDAVEKFKADPSAEVVLERILKFLTEWLTKHILSEDRHYAEYLLG